MMAHREYTLNIYIQDEETYRLKCIYCLTFKVHPRIHLTAVSKVVSGKIELHESDDEWLEGRRKLIEDYVMKLRPTPTSGENTWDISPSTYTPEDIKHIKWLKVIESL